jgi:pimeloyl-ACP methyl ester carboxylesterase
MKRREFLMTTTATGLSAAAGMALALPAGAFAQTAEEAGSTASETGYAPVNGLEMYYEIHGEGEPIVLLHGGLSTIDVPGGALLAFLARERQVVAVEQQAHGRTVDIDRPITYENMADDTAALIGYLGLEQPDVVGFSMGGTTAMGMAIRHPGIVRRYVTISSPFNYEQGFRPENLEGSRTVTVEGLTGTPFEQAYLDVAPDPAGFATLVAKVAELNQTFAGWAPEDLQAIETPFLNIVGDADAIELEHALELLRLMGGDVNGDFVGVPASRLGIVPGATHFSILGRPDILLPMILPYLNAPFPRGSSGAGKPFLARPVDSRHFGSTM